MNRRTVPFVLAALLAALPLVGVAPASAQSEQPIQHVTLTGEGVNSRVTVSLNLTLEYVVHDMLEKAGVSYVLPGFACPGMVKLKDVPFATALTQLLSAATPPMTYRIENGVYIIYAKPKETPVPMTPDAATLPAPAEPTAIPATDSPVVTALRMQQAKLEIKRDIALAAPRRDLAALRKMETELKAIRAALDRRRYETAEYQAVMRLRRQRDALLAGAYLPNSQPVREIDQQIASMTLLLERRIH